MSRPARRTGLALCLLAAALPCPARADDVTVERRMQPVLKISGTFQADGFRVAEVDQAGPGANLALVGSRDPVRGILDPGDVVVAIDGKAFRDDVEWFDLLHRGHKAGGGRVTLSVLDVRSGRVVAWSVAPELALRDVPIRVVATAVAVKNLPPDLPKLRPLPDDLP